MSVIATDESDQLANYSNYGLHNTDIAAPGSKILSTVPNGQVGLQNHNYPRETLTHLASKPSVMPSHVWTSHRNYCLHTAICARQIAHYGDAWDKQNL